MDKIIFIINPTAGGGRTSKLIPVIENKLKEKGAQFDIVLTKRPKEAIEIAKKKLEEGYTKIVAVGGDGTVNEVAFGIISHGKGTLGIVPSGTGNDLARLLNIPSDLDKAIDFILNGHTKNIDIGYVNDSLFLNIASIGFDSEVVKTTNKVKNKIKSGLAYVIALFITLFRFDSISLELQIDDYYLKEKALLVAVGNGKYYGGGINILPMADIEDGYFNVLVIKKLSKIKFLLLLPTIINGSHINLEKYVKVFKAKKVVVRTDNSDSYLNIDGELNELKNETFFTIGEGKLSVLVND